MKTVLATLTATLLATSAAVAVTPDNPLQPQREYDVLGEAPAGTTGDTTRLPASAILAPEEQQRLHLDSVNVYDFAGATTEAPAPSEVR